MPSVRLPFSLRFPRATVDAEAFWVVSRSFASYTGDHTSFGHVGNIRHEGGEAVAKVAKGIWHRASVLHRIFERLKDDV